MTPPDNNPKVFGSSQGSSWLTELPLANSCPSNACHQPAPQSFPKNSPFFMADAGASNHLNPRPNFRMPQQLALSAQDLKVMQDWLTQLPGAENKTPENQSQNKVFLETAQKYEELAKKSPNTSQKLEYFHTALFNYRLAQEPNKVTATLLLIRHEYQKTKNEVGLAKVDAELDFLKGNFKAALNGFKSLEEFFKNPQTPLSPDERTTVLTEINLKISLVLQALAAQEHKENNNTSAASHLEEALKRTPSPLIFQKYVQVLSQIKKGEFASKQNQITELRASIQKTKINPRACNVNCHSRNESVSSFPPFPNNSLEQLKIQKGPFRLTPQKALSEADKKMISAWLKGETLPEQPLSQGAEKADARNPYVHESPSFYSNIPELKAVEKVKSQEPLIDVSCYENLYHLTYEEKVWLLYAESSLEGLEKELLEDKKAFVSKIRQDFEKNCPGEDKFSRELFVAEVMTAAGDPYESMAIYQGLLKENKNPGNLIQRGVISNKLAALYMGHGSQGTHSKRMWNAEFKEAIQILDTSHAELQTIPASKEKEFLLLQNRFLKAEMMLSQAQSNEEIDQAQGLLEQLVRDYSVCVPTRESQDLKQPLLNRVQLRLAQVYFSRKEHHSKGCLLVDQIIRDNPQDSYLVSSAMLSKGLAKMQNSQALEGLQILREVQIKYPNSEADLAIRNSSKLESVKGPEGIIRANIQESDIGEALKVALDRSGDTPAWRKLGFAGAGMLLAILLAPEVTIPVLIAGGGGGLLVDRGVGVAEHWDDVRDAYLSGMSDVDMSRNMMNLFMLGLDISMLIGAGAGGSIAKGLVKSGMSRATLSVSESLAKFGLTTFEKKMLGVMGGNVGKFGMYLIPAATESTVAYTIYKGERSLFLGEDFVWDPKEAILMFGMCESFSRAKLLGAGTRLSLNPKFSSGALSPVVQEGKLLGYTNSAGKFVSWTTDTVVGATVYYGLLLGVDATSGLPGGVHRYDDFLIDQLKTLGALHAGSKAVGKWSSHGLEGVLSKLDQKANARLRQAKQNIENAQEPGGWGGFGPQLAYAGANGGRFVAGPGPTEVQIGPQVLMMSDLNPSGGGFTENKNLTPLKLDTSQLSQSQKIELENWLVGRKTEALSISEQRALAEYLVIEKAWKGQDLQKLIGPEGMKQFLGYGRDLPFGFKSIEQWHQFQRNLLMELHNAGLDIYDPSITVIVQGSSVRGRNNRDKGPFRWEGNPEAGPKDKSAKPSDVDIAVVVSPAQFNRYLERKIQGALEFRAANGKNGGRDVIPQFREMGDKGRLSYFGMPRAFQQARNNLLGTYPDFQIQISIMRPGCEFIPPPAEMMEVSTAILLGAP